MKKSRAQKRVIRKYRKIPFFWKIEEDTKYYIIAINWFTGTSKVFDK